MYYPYLRARQFELISLRELASEKVLQKNIIPVLEPVKESFTNLNIAHKIFINEGQNAYLILNPFQGEKKGDTSYFLSYLTGLENSKYLPAFHFADNKAFIESSISQYHLTNCMVICLDNFAEEESFKELCQHPAITHIMLLEPNKYRNLDKFLKKLNKTYIRLDDVFEKQPKNADYLDIAAHKFSEEHLYYKMEHYKGFSDFTVLPNEFIDGGSTPRAVVIHLTYINHEEEDQIWIRHFTSTLNDSIANVQGKFEIAAKKTIDYCTVNNINNSAITELRNYLNEGKYPGLGTVKKISIKNHLTIVSNYLK